ncbi:MAG TPA: glutamate-1-semialdehyde 2,1-aminomutase [Rhabdochlamydiaceae bacterium]|nr:glutamate-1-semialdehyde 2,1-aminomutase [Rhabdochlamydiaceae bacterium]
MRQKSREIFQESCAVIPGGVNSPTRAFPGLEMTPLIAARGQGAVVWDADGHPYIDYCCSWGALILGHCHPLVVKEATDQMRLGAGFGMATPVELLIAKKIRSHLPSMEKIRFVSSGTEATMSAIRVARGYTGKDKIIKFEGHYHGHSDGLLIKAGSGAIQINSEASSKGVPADFVRHTVCLPFNDLKTVRDYLRSHDDIAGVIIEPVAGNMGLVPSDPDFLQMIREETEKKGIVLIFDEVISGFRVGLQGAQGLYRITPDLTCLGKIIGAGFPAAAFGGKVSMMNHLAPLGEVYQAGTLSGHPVVMRAGLAGLEELEQPGFYEKLENKTVLLAESIRQMMHDQKITGCVNQLGSMFTPFFGSTEVRHKMTLDQQRYSQFFKFLFERGIYIAPSPYEANFVSSAHTDEQILRTCEAFGQACFSACF